MKLNEKSRIKQWLFPAIKIAVLLAVLLLAAIGWRAYRLRSAETDVIERLRQLNADFGKTSAGPRWLTDWLTRHNLPTIKRCGSCLL